MSSSQAGLILPQSIPHIMNQRTVFLFVAVAALGAVGVTTAIMSAAAPAQAGSCQKQYGKDSCHGCDFRGPGIFSSDGECHHRAP